MKVLTRQEFAALLRDVASKVESGDSLEGSLSYTYTRDESLGVEVEGALRVGNLDGQGGVVLL